MKKLLKMLVPVTALAFSAATAEAADIYGAMYMSDDWSSSGTFVNKRAIYSFNPENMDGYTRHTPEGSITVSNGGAYANGYYYFLNGNASYTGVNMTFNKLNTNTWVVEDQSGHIGNTKTLAYDLAYDYTTGKMYASSFNFNDSDMPYVLREVDLETGEFSDVARLGTAYTGIAFDADGQLYGFTKASSYPYAISLHKINKTTGEATKIGELGYNQKSSACGAVMDYSTGKLYYATRTFTYDSYYQETYSDVLLEVDVKTGAATVAGNLGSGVQFTSLFAIDTHPKAPATPADLTFEFDKGDMNRGVVKFTAPSKDYSGNPISGALMVTMTVDGKSTTMRTSAGATFTSSPLTLEGTGNHEISVVLMDAARRNSIPAKIKVYSGEDLPGKVTDINVTTTPRGETATVTWTPAETGKNGGFVDASKLTYKVIRRPDMLTVAEGLTECKFVDTPDRSMLLSQYEIVAVSEVGSSESAYSSTIRVGKPYVVPYLETFDTVSNYNAFTSIDVDGDERKNGDADDGNVWMYHPTNREAIWWLAYGGERRCANDWLISPTIEFQPGHVYRIDCDIHGYTGDYDWISSTFRIALGSEPTAEAMTNEIFSRSYTGSIRTHASSLFQPNEGDCRVGFYVWNNGYDHMGLDNIYIRYYGPSTIPGACTQLKGEKQDDKVAITFHTPAVTVVGDKLTSLKAAYVYRAADEALVAKMDNPAIDSDVTLYDNKPVFGVNNYIIVVENESGEGMEAYLSVNTCPDVPVDVQNVTVQAQNRGMDAMISWTYPSDMKGANGEVIDPSELSYSILRGTNIYNLVEIASGIKDTKYLDADVTSSFSARQELLVYSIVAETAGGVSKGSTAEILMGIPYELPVNEGFTNNGIRPWQNINGNSASWSQATTGYDPRADSFDGDGYLISFSPSFDNRVGSCDYASAYVNLSGMLKPYITFAVYHDDIDNLDGASVQAGVIAAVDGIAGEVELVGSPIPARGEKGWKEYTVSLEKYAACDRVRIVFRGIGYKRNGHIHVDKLYIGGEKPEYDVRMTTLSGPSNAVMGRSNTYTAFVENSGKNAQENCSVEFYVNGEKAYSKSISLAVGAMEEVTFDYKPELNNDEYTVALVARIVSDKDDNANNNDASMNVNAICPLLPYVSEIQAHTVDGKHVQLSWNEADAYPQSASVMDNLESYPAFSITGAGDWKFVDKDGLNTLPAIGSSTGTTYTWTNSGLPQAYIVFNPVSVGIGDLCTPRSGKLCFVSFATTTQNDDWLISPMLAGTKQTVVFYARCLYAAAGPDEKFEFWYSTTGNNVEDFIKMGVAQTVSSDTWRRFSYNLPAGARYFAVRCVSENQWGLMLDDFEYTPAQGSVELYGYNVYRDDELIAQEVPMTSHLDENVDLSNERSYHVSVVYEEGESIYSKKALVDASGVDYVESAQVSVFAQDGSINVLGAQDQYLAVYSTDGRTIYGFVATASEKLDVAPGIYLVAVGNTTYKVIVK